MAEVRPRQVSPPPRELPPDIRRALAFGAAALGAVGIYTVWIIGDIARKGKVVPAILGVIATSVIEGLRAFGRWVIDFQSGRRPRE
jgi:hypothetical protein